MKVGVFNASFNDHRAGMAGLPIQTSFRLTTAATSGLATFGVGWTLSISNVRLQKKRQLRAQLGANGVVRGLPATVLRAVADVEEGHRHLPDGRSIASRPGPRRSASSPGLFRAEPDVHSFRDGGNVATPCPFDGGAALWDGSESPDLSAT